MEITKMKRIKFAFIIKSKNMFVLWFFLFHIERSSIFVRYSDYSHPSPFLPKTICDNQDIISLNTIITILSTILVLFGQTNKMRRYKNLWIQLERNQILFRTIFLIGKLPLLNRVFLFFASDQFPHFLTMDTSGK